MGSQRTDLGEAPPSVARLPPSVPSAVRMDADEDPEGTSSELSAALESARSSAPWAQSPASEKAADSNAPKISQVGYAA